MQTLRKKTSPCKYKNEPSRFLGEGVSFKAKLIGILEVSEARGDRMCQEALADLKMAIRAAGEHKQRITINIAIDGLRLRDEKTGDSLYHHPVHKISFIAQDMSDSRAFGYIFGSPDTGHRFFGIKTDKAASQVVIAMRDLFQVVFELKKKEIELAKQHIEQKGRFGSNTASSLFSDSAISNTKSYQNGDSQHSSNKLTSVSESSTSKVQSNSSEGATARPSTTSESAIADLVDLELELSSIQQGIHQMERITPSDPFGPNKDDPFGSDPFGDSFTSFPQKPFLPPPPSARDRPSRTASASDTSGSLFSPRTPKTGGSVDTASQDLFKNSHDEQNSSGWFTPTGGPDSLFEDVVPISETGSATKEAEGTPAKESNASILSQFDVFTELDPLGTGRSKPYIDKKLFFQELKNPPKKVLKDLVTETQPTEASLFTANFETNTHTTTTFTNSTTNALFQTDPFADGDPFDKTDPFAEDDFAKVQDPFDTDFVGDFKLYNKQDLKPVNKSDASAEYSEKFKFPDKLQPLFPSPLSKSPNRSSIFEKQISLSSTHVSPRNTSSLTKQSTFDVKFDNDKKSFSKLSQLHENPSLDMSSESECAPEPPPRPATNITPIKPPPLPPKKQPGDLAIKPPPRPPHSEESHYDYMDTYETGLNSLESFDNVEQTPPLPVPVRKSRFDNSDFNLAPQRPKKQFQSQSSDDDYLTPIAPPLLPPQKKESFRNMTKDSGPILLPPPMKKDSSKRSDRSINQSQVTVASYLESKPKIISTTATDKLNLTPDTLDITLSQLTLSGLNELANKLNIPASQLSNMTLVQLTTFLSNYFKTNNTNTVSSETSSNDATFPTFKADFSANFNDLNNSVTKTEPYDRYAVFRELLQQEEMNKENESTAQEKEETPQTEEPSATISQDDEQKLEETNENVETKPTFQESNMSDKYAALREIVIENSVINEIKENNLETEEINETKINKQNEDEKQQNNLNQDSTKIKDESDINDKLNREVESNIIEYENSLEPIKEKIKSPVLIKSPVPIAISEIIQNSNHLTSGSVSDVVSGSSPEIDNVGSTSEVVSKKNVENTTRESWAIFDTPNHRRDVNKEKQVQSEEGVSPWSSDSKEFGNGSPSDWQHRRDSGSEGDWARRRRDRDNSWWDSQGESGGHYDKPSRAPYPRERRSTDSYEDEWYEPDPPRRRTRQPASTNTWSKSGGSGTVSGGAGGQSSSSRDVSPWEEDEPRTGRRDREDRECWSGRRARGPSWDRDRRRRRDDSWDEEDDYEYEDEYMTKCHWPERHGSRESDRASRDSDRHSGPRDPDHWDNDSDKWLEERRHGRRRGHPQEERWCRPDWDHDSDTVCASKEKMRYSNSRWPNQEGKWRGDRDRKRDSDRYYKRDHSQESPWEDDYSNDPDEPHSPRYLSARRNWKRPASASEMDRKSGEIKSRQPYYMGTGGSDGERDRKYRTNRRSRSRDSQFSELSHQRHKPDTSLTLGRYSYRDRDKIYRQKFDNDFSQDVKLDSSKKSATLGRKKGKELPSPKIENETISGKGNRKQHLMFENDFINSEADSPVVTKTKFNFENELETSETESPITRYSKPLCDFQSKRNLRLSKEHSKSARLQDREPNLKNVSSSLQINVKQKSLFEDDFSPTEKLPAQNIEGITVIAEETTSETRVSFTENNLDRATPSEIRKQNKHILTKNRIANNIRGDGHIKKSESVNIFARENDPFDDDFFSGRESGEIQKVENTKTSPNNVTEFKWTEDFDSFDISEENK